MVEELTSTSTSTFDFFLWCCEENGSQRHRQRQSESAKGNESRSRKFSVPTDYSRATWIFSMKKNIFSFSFSFSAQFFFFLSQPTFAFFTYYSTLNFSFPFGLSF